MKNMCAARSSAAATVSAAAAVAAVVLVLSIAIGDHPAHAFQRARQLVRTRRNLLLPTSRTDDRTRRNLFSLQFNNFNDPGRKDDDEEGEAEPDWVQALLRWNSQPTMTPNDNGSDKNNEKTPTSGADDKTKPKKSPIPLAALVNVEALLMASSADGEVDAADIIGRLGLGTFADTSSESDERRNRKSSAKSTKSGSDQKSSGSSSSSSLSTGGNSKEEDPLAMILSALPKLEEQGDWNKILSSLQQSVVQRSSSDGEALAFAAEGILKEATSRMEMFLNETASVVPPGTVELVVMRASQALKFDEGAAGIKTVADSIVRAAEDLAREQGLNVTEAADRARATTQYTAQLVDTANGLLVAGYVQGADEVPSGAISGSIQSGTAVLDDIQRGIIPTSDRSSAFASDSSSMKPLFHRFKSAKPVHKDDYKTAILKSATMASLAGAIYQDTIEICHSINHALVANGTSADVAWMVTDSVGFEDDYREEISPTPVASRDNPILVRTITIRGYDASDENVDRELLLYRICEGEKTPLGKSGIMVHKGLLEIAEELYSDVTTYIDLAAAPTHKIVLNGHSVGGSLSVLLLMLLVERRGVDYVLDNFLRVYTFGSPPISIAPEERKKKLFRKKNRSADSSDMTCTTLQTFGLPADFVYQYIQPWDPVVRLFSEIDPCYPLLEDIGEDGITLYASGPSRALRPITRAIIESWEGWPRFRKGFVEQSNQGYTGVGVQYLLLPDPTRYLADRLVSVNIAIPPVYSVIQLSPRELIPALKETFPLDEFSISFVPAALRSFIHHFYPAYTSPFVDYATDKKRVPSEVELISPNTAVTDDDVEKRSFVWSWPILGGEVVKE